jgi:hypothetical protein
MEIRTGVLTLIVLLTGGCRCSSELGEDHASLRGAAETARSFWLDVMAARYDSAETYLASDQEIRAAFHGWSRLMNEQVDEADIDKQVEEASGRLWTRWSEIRGGASLPEGLDPVGLGGADTIYCNKLFLGPDVSYVQELILTREGVGERTVHVAGAVRVGGGGWKILWLP